MFFFPVFFAIYLIIVFKFYFLYDTPKFYSIKNLEDKADLAISFIYGGSSKSFLLRNINISETQKSSEIVKFSEILCSKRFRIMLRVAIILPMLEQLCGIVAVTFYSTKILYDISGDLYISRLLTSALGITKFVATFLILILVQKFGRKTLLIGSMIIMGMLCVLFGLFTSIANFGIYPSTIVMALHMIVYTSSYAAILWVYIGESLDQQIVAIAVGSKFTFSILITFIFPLSVDYLGISVVFYFFAICMAIGFIYGKLELIETKGKSRQEITELFTRIKL